MNKWIVWLSQTNKQICKPTKLIRLPVKKKFLCEKVSFVTVYMQLYILVRDSFDVYTELYHFFYHCFRFPSSYVYALFLVRNFEILCFMDKKTKVKKSNRKDTTFWKEFWWEADLYTPPLPPLPLSVCPFLPSPPSLPTHIRNKIHNE